MTDIQNEIKALRQSIKDSQLKIQSIQSECPHESGVYAYGANTGNWSDSDDSYWIRCVCGSCDLNWSEYSEDTYGVKNPKYREIPNSPNWRQAR